ncbi:hypothetical protein JB92DRAFT_183484 [Gautieria morchelliformis]|nr:hypothetical protein JB92DRAFT_183484 [Gautieria morchelliformis]
MPSQSASALDVYVLMRTHRRFKLRHYRGFISWGTWINYCQISGITILFYDYILTLPREISLVWRWPWHRFDFRPSISMSSLLYVLMRHTLLVSWVVTLILSLHPKLVVTHG